MQCQGRKRNAVTPTCSPLSFLPPSQLNSICIQDTPASDSRNTQGASWMEQEKYSCSWPLHCGFLCTQLPRTNRASFNCMVSSRDLSCVTTCLTPWSKVQKKKSTYNVHLHFQQEALRDYTPSESCINTNVLSISCFYYNAHLERTTGKEIT